jgi:hypothetical protein
MKVIYMPVYKAVIYAGEELVVPDWVKFIATNSDGGIWGWRTWTGPVVARRR